MPKMERSPQASLACRYSKLAFPWTNGLSINERPEPFVDRLCKRFRTLRRLVYQSNMYLNTLKKGIDNPVLQ